MAGRRRGRRVSHVSHGHTRDRAARHEEALNSFHSELLEAPRPARAGATRLQGTEGRRTCA